MKTVIIVSDNTRANPYKSTLTLLVNYLIESGQTAENLKIVIATGTHPPMSESQINQFYGLGNSSIEITNHNCYADNLVNLGKLSTGNTLLLNKLVYEADFVITTGIINTHYLAGFSAGRKAILPGVCGYETIRQNHSLVQDERVKLLNLTDNPINLEMEEAFSKVKSGFNISFVMNEDKKIEAIFAGHPIQSFKVGVKYLIDHKSVNINKHFDVVITSPGGEPKDKTIYHSQKCLNNVVNLVKKEGTIVVFSACKEGIGSESMEKYLGETSDINSLLTMPPEEITVGGHRAVATAQILKKAEVIFITELEKNYIESLHFSWQKEWDECLVYLKQKHGNAFKAAVIPNGNFFVGKTADLL